MAEMRPLRRQHRSANRRASQPDWREHCETFGVLDQALAVQLRRVALVCRTLAMAHCLRELLPSGLEIFLSSKDQTLVPARA